jgi:pyruvate formate lyase activating enzyme
MIKEAMLYNSLDKLKVACRLCAHFCEIVPGKTGFCGVRENRDGKLFSLVYGDVIASHVDPIEKKPLYHFFPGSLSYSVATIGCNFRCSFCQNWQISQASREKNGGLSGQNLEPSEVVTAALKHGCRSISYTYTEPTIFFEYAYDTARLAKKKGIANVFVTNGYMSAQALETIHPYLDACNVDLKSFREDFYKKICRASLEPVLESIRLMKRLDIWVEVTTLVVPGQNDSSEELAEIAGFIASVDRNIPWHISRFHPDYLYTDSKATPLDTLSRALEIGRNAGLHFIYIGNVLGMSEDTLCPVCGAEVIRRTNFSIANNKLKEGVCTFCGAAVSGRFK